MFEILSYDKNTKARCGLLRTGHGVINTPVFMPVATQASVKGISQQDLKECGIEMIIANTYHLFLRPGKEIISNAGGLHDFMGWKGAITTDSGGFQVFSLSGLRKIKENGVEFKSHIDGKKIFFTPESVVDFQAGIGSDIIMPLDECVKYPQEKNYVLNSVKLTVEWAEKSLKRFKEVGADSSSKLFGIIQGGTYRRLRKMCVEKMAVMDFDGFAIGGIGVGEDVGLIDEITSYTCDLLPIEKTRYLMGVGTPVNMLQAIASGVDMFDCVVPTRNGRNGQAFTFDGEKQIRNAVFKDDHRPIDENCGCIVCRNYTRAYLRHLINVGEMLPKRLISLHNIYFYARLIELCRENINSGTFDQFMKGFISKFNTNTA